MACSQGRGGSTGYDNAVALPGRSDAEELAKENNKSTKPLKGQAVFSVAKVCIPGLSHQHCSPPSQLKVHDCQRVSIGR